MARAKLKSGKFSDETERGKGGSGGGACDLLVIIFLSPNTIRNGTGRAIIAIIQLNFHLFLLALFHRRFQLGETVA